MEAGRFCRKAFRNPGTWGSGGQPVEFPEIPKRLPLDFDWLLRWNSLGVHVGTPRGPNWNSLMSQVWVAYEFPGSPMGAQCGPNRHPDGGPVGIPVGITWGPRWFHVGKLARADEVCTEIPGFPRSPNLTFFRGPSRQLRWGPPRCHRWGRSRNALGASCEDSILRPLYP